MFTKTLAKFQNNMQNVYINSIINRNIMKKHMNLKCLMYVRRRYIKEKKKGGGVWVGDGRRGGCRGV